MSPLTLARGGLALAGAWLAATAAYLLVVLAAAARAPRRPPAPPPDEAGRRFVVVVPARDEAAVVGDTVRALHALDFPPARRAVVVVADTCADATAARAREAGAHVLERHDPAHPGKGSALAWALPRILEAWPSADAVVLVDADCRASAGLLRAIDARLAAGAVAVQCDYVVANPDASAVAALRFAAFALINTVRPLGRCALGGSAGLMGTGMAFTRELLAEHPWTALSDVEDREQHLGLVAAGRRVAFAPEARVTSPLPVTLGEQREQHARWERGRLPLLRRWLGPLARAGVRGRDPAALHAIAEGLVPPQSARVLGALAVLALATPLHARGARRLAGAAAVADAAHLVGGLALVGAPPAVWRALAAAPALVAWKAGLYASLAVGRGPRSWGRAARPGSPS